MIRFGQKIKFACLAFLLIEARAVGDEPKLGFYPALTEDGQPADNVISSIEAKADRVVWWDIKERFDLGLGGITDGVRSPIKLSYEEIREFLKDEKHKGLIVVRFDKSVMWNENEVILERAGKVVKQMTAVGYLRVVILGAHAVGVHYIADTDLEPREAER